MNKKLTSSDASRQFQSSVVSRQSSVVSRLPSPVSLPTWFIGPWELSKATAHLPPTPTAGRVLLIESTDKGSALPWHRWKLVLVLSALRHFAEELRGEGYQVDHRVAPSYAKGIRDHIAEFGPSEVVAQEPAEWGISRSVGEVARLLPDRRFLTTRQEFARWAQGRKLLRMEDFYRWQRKRLRILVDRRGEPEGGRWNLDRENRQSARALLKRGLPRAPISFEHDAITRKVMRLVTRMDHHWGSVDGFDLPVTRDQALAALKDFLDHRLADFGPYEDAMLSGQTYLYHSRLSAAMNVGLLHPREMIDAAIEQWQGVKRGTQNEERGTIPLQSLEGFVRQIIGWREYVNGIYWTQMPNYREANYFGFERPLPQLYWDPELTDLACLRDSVRMVKDHAYAHHIHRLMVLSNFANLAGVNPLRLSEWFWAGFADAMEWVELPNVVGMSTFGDGGLLASKPYVSSAAYINRMSNYCGGCRYDPKLRVGDDACPFNYMYWSFLDHVANKKFDVGQRMALVLKQAAAIPAEEMRAMKLQRQRFVESLKPDDTGWAFRFDQG